MLTFSTFTVFSQSLSRPNAWKKFKKELTFQMGTAAFLGDLGGRDRKGTDFSPADLDLKSMRQAITVGYRYRFSKNIFWYSSINYLRLYGDDKFTNDKFRNNRNLNFKSNVFEVLTRFEFGISSLKLNGTYSVKKSLAKSRLKKPFELIGFVGIGTFYFNPKGEDPNTGKYIALRPLHTEGQGLAGGPKQYSNFSVCIPVGVALRTILDKYWSVGLELNYRFTITDYLDDVSTTYYNKAQLDANYGTQSGIMADKNLGLIDGATLPNADGTGSQRGDKNLDSYMSIQVTVGRFFPPKRGRTRLRSKF